MSVSRVPESGVDEGNSSQKLSHLVTLIAGEALRVPGPPQSRHHLTHYRLPTGPAHALLLDPHSLLVHVLLEVAQHHVQAGGAAYHRLIHIPSVHLEIVERHHQMVQLLGGRGCPGVRLISDLLGVIGVIILMDSVGLLSSCPSPSLCGVEGVLTLLDVVILNTFLRTPPPNKGRTIGAVLGVLVLPDPVSHVLPLGLAPLGAEAPVVSPLSGVYIVMMISIIQRELPTTG